MANYGLLISDNGNGSFSILALNRGTTTTSFTGGTDMNTNTFTVTATTGLPATISGNTVTGNQETATGSLGKRRVTPGEVCMLAGEMMNNDRAFNGN